MWKIVWWFCGLQKRALVSSDKTYVHGCEWWWWQLKLPHGFCTFEWGSEKSYGAQTAGMIRPVGVTVVSVAACSPFTFFSFALSVSLPDTPSSFSHFSHSRCDQVTWWFGPFSLVSSSILNLSFLSLSTRFRCFSPLSCALCLMQEGPTLPLWWWWQIQHPDKPNKATNHPPILRTHSKTCEIHFFFSHLPAFFAAFFKIPTIVEIHENKTWYKTYESDTKHDIRWQKTSTHKLVWVESCHHHQDGTVWDGLKSSLHSLRQQQANGSVYNSNKSIYMAWGHMISYSLPPLQQFTYAPLHLCSHQISTADKINFQSWHRNEYSVHFWYLQTLIYHHLPIWKGHFLVKVLAIHYPSIQSLPIVKRSISTGGDKIGVFSAGRARL